MSKQITFFGDRLQTAGHTYKFEVDDGTRILRFSVFSQKPLEEKLVKTRPLPKENKGDLQLEINKIKSAILEGQGGVIAVIYEENRNRYLWTIPVSPQSESAFGSVGVLRPGHPSLDLEPLQPTKGIVPLPAGSHALIPVDLEAEKRLRGFQDHLGCLPADLESLVLHTLRHPSLEARVGFLEEIARKDTGEPPSGKSWAHRIFPFLAKTSWGSRPVSLWRLTAVLLGLVLVANTVVLYSILQTDNGSIVVPFISREKAPAAAAATPSQKIFELIEAVRGKAANANMAALAQGHFAQVRREEDLRRILTPGAEGQLLVRGLMKIEAFHLDRDQGGQLFDDAKNWSDVNGFYNGRELEAESRNMLAALACAAFASPRLPETERAQAVSFADAGEDCTSFPLEKASPGLDDLLKLVQEAG